MAKRQTAWGVALAAIAVALVACGSAPAPAQAPAITLAVTMLIPSATPAPTPVPPTRPAEPAMTDTPQPPPDNTLQAAILKTIGAASYQVEMAMTGSGQPFAALSEDDPGAEVMLMAISGQHSRQNAAFTLSGLAAVLLGGGQDGVQVIAADGKTYLRGPAPLLGAIEERWYILPEEQASAARAPVETLQFLGRFADDNAGAFVFDRAGSQELEGRSCEVYTADAAATREALASFGASVLPGAGSLSMQAGAFSIWACDDGYVHRLEMNFDLGSTDGENKVIVFRADVRLHDHNAAITIAAPTDAIALDLPGLITPTP